jgi:hypothetical protein
VLRAGEEADSPRDERCKDALTKVFLNEGKVKQVGKHNPSKHNPSGQPPEGFFRFSNSDGCGHFPRYASV